MRKSIIRFTSGGTTGRKCFVEKVSLTSLTLCLILGTSTTWAANPPPTDQPHPRPYQRACDNYIKQYCSNSDDKGPGCLKGHEKDVSADCLKDMQRPPPPGRSCGTNANGLIASWIDCISLDRFWCEILEDWQGQEDCW